MEAWLQRLQLQWLDRLQSRLVLPTARTLYLLVAGACVAIALIGLLIALVFQAATWQPARQERVPEAVAARQAPVNFQIVRQRLSPPTNVRFTPDGNLPGPLGAGDVVGRFEADTPNGLAPYPDDFQIVGGRDVDLFTEDGQYRNGMRTVLRAQQQVADEINAPGARGTSRPYHLRIVARDAYGNYTAPADVTFVLSFSAAPEATPAEDGTPAALRQIARQLADIVDPTRSTPAHYEAYRVALNVPARCGAERDEAFITMYGQALAQSRARLTPSNLGAFYEGVCDAWRDSLSRGVQAANAANAERAAIIARNVRSQMQAAGARLSSRAFRNLALTVVGGAVFAFMVVALFLAFLAIEGHSSAMRQAIALIAARDAPEEDAVRPLRSDAAE